MVHNHRAGHALKLGRVLAGVKGSSDLQILIKIKFCIQSRYKNTHNLSIS